MNFQKDCLSKSPRSSNKIVWLMVIAMTFAVGSIYLSDAVAQNECITRNWCDQNGNCRDVQMSCDKGYHLYFNSEHVSGPDALYYSREQAEQNCQWNIQTKPDIAISCTYNGVVFYPVNK
ncbi:MAG: hypothetical protein C0392_09975 [Syntrophus sp. (in: bacteria)]|nr:hypothetical protein [Syntrophus sp. (in: bacteria)]